MDDSKKPDRCGECGQEKPKVKIERGSGPFLTVRELKRLTESGKKGSRTERASQRRCD